MQKELEAQYSPQQRAENKALQEASGVAGNLKAAWEHPTAVAAMVGESIPSIFAGGIIGKIGLGVGIADNFANNGFNTKTATDAAIKIGLNVAFDSQCLSLVGTMIGFFFDLFKFFGTYFCPTFFY